MLSFMHSEQLQTSDSVVFYGLQQKFLSKSNIYTCHWLSLDEPF